MFKKVVAGLLILTALLVLINLGLWQLDRLEWKEAIIEKIAKANETDIETNAIVLEEATEFQRGYLKGHFVDTGKAPLKIAPRTHDGAVGAHIVRPFQTADGHYILVNNGWISADFDGFPKVHFQPMTIVGHLRLPEEAGMFTPKNRPESNLWYNLDIDQISDYYGLPFEDYVFYNEGDYTLPTPFDGLPQPRNKHMQYAAFWFSMAGVLILLVGFILYRRRQP